MFNCVVGYVLGIAISLSEYTHRMIGVLCG